MPTEYTFTDSEWKFLINDIKKISAMNFVFRDSCMVKAIDQDTKHLFVMIAEYTIIPTVISIDYNTMLLISKKGWATLIYCCIFHQKREECDHLQNVRIRRVDRL